MYFALQSEVASVFSSNVTLCTLTLVNNTAGLAGVLS